MTAKLTSYSNIPNQSWQELLTENWGDYQRPFTVNLPIQPAHSPDVIHVNGSLTACRRRIVQGLRSDDTEGYRKVRRNEAMLVEFALGNPPAVPDFRRGRISMEQGTYPLATVSHCTPAVAPGYVLINGLHFKFEYFCSPLPGSSQSLLWIGCEVTSDAEIPVEAHVRAKLAYAPEEDIFDYHYIPFHWDVTKYPPCGGLGLRDERILRDGRVIGKILPGGFACEWEEARDFPDTGYKEDLFCVPASLRYKNVRNAIHFEAKLAPGETRKFQLALFTDYEQIAPGHLEALGSADAMEARSRALRHFQSLSPKGVAELTCAAGRWSELFKHQAISTLQLLIRFPQAGGLVPTQGGSSERHFVWVWEAVFMLMPFLKLGRFQPVREALEYIFSLQDAGCPPKGKLVSTRGAIGTTGPKWMNTTGAALGLASDYYRYSRDEDFLEGYLPKILSAVDWIVGELRATRRLDEDGGRPLSYGLMPFGCATDGDEGYCVAFTDAYTFWGFSKAVLLLEDLGHPGAPLYRRELDAYRDDIQTAVSGLTRPDGFIERKIVTGDKDEVICRQFENLIGAFHLAFCGALDVRSPAFQKYRVYFEEHMAHGAFTSRMDREIMYMGIGEWVWQDMYLRLGEWKKAFAAVQINLKYGMTPDAHQVQERFSLTDPAFHPWQPNGSGNGKVLDMILKSFYFEHDHRVTLLGGIPFAWLRNNGTTALRNLHTPRGRLDLEAEMQDDGSCEVRLGADRPEAMPEGARLPDHLTVLSCGDGCLADEDHFIRFIGNGCEAVFRIVDSELSPIFSREPARLLQPA